MKQRSSLAMFIVITAVMTWAHSAFADPVLLTTIPVAGSTLISVDSQGNQYISQTTQHTVRINNRKGQHVNTLSVGYPLGVMVDAAGRIYVSSDRDKKIHIFNADLSPAGIFADADGRISSNSITMDKAGRIYIVDHSGDCIRVYEADGRPAFTFGGSGNTDGLFNTPTSLAVNDALGEIYVSDLQIRITRYGATRMARIQVFDKSGAWKRTFAQDGSDVPGQLASPVGIAVDTANNVYVADSFLNGVLIFDPYGAYKGFLNRGHPIELPVGLAVGRNNLAYVTSNAAGTVEVYALDGYVTMETAPESLAFAGRQFSDNPPSQVIAVANSGSGTLNWTASASADTSWITLDRTSGSTGPADANGLASSTGLAVNADLTNLAAGVYNGSVSIVSDLNQINIVPVSLTVLPPPIFSLSGLNNNGGLDFTVKKGKTASHTITAIVENTESLSWSAASDSTTWLGMSPAGGTSTASAVVTVNATELAVGLYSGYITFRAVGALGDGSKIAVILKVEASTKISVATNLSAAGFSITGPVSYTGAGQSWSVENVPPGTYAIAYDTVKGYQKPRSETLTIADSGELVFNGTYISDEQSPELTLSTLVDGSYTNNNTLNIAGTATDNLTVQEVTINGATVTVNEDGVFSQAIQLAVGSNRVETAVTDGAGNTTTDVRTITLDQTAPVITIDYPADNSVTNEPKPVFTGTVDKIAFVSIQVIGENSEQATMSGNAFSLAVALPYGQNTIQVTATDRAGNVGTVKRTVLFDNANPTLGVTNPAQDISTNQTNITLQGTVADLTGVTVTVAMDEMIYTPAVTNGTFEQQLAFATEKTYAIIVSAADAVGNTTTLQRNIIYAKTPSVLTYSGKAFIAQGRPAALSAVLKTDGPVAPNLSGQTVTFTLGSGAGSQSCKGTTDATGTAGCTINPVTLPLGPTTVAVAFGGDGEIKPSSDSKNVTVFAYLGAGSFVIGDQNAAMNSAVTFWDAQWSKVNTLSNGTAPDSFKGFADSAGDIASGCGGTWSAGSGNSSTPPGEIPLYMAVIVSGSITKSGGIIEGNVPEIVIVRTNQGYGPDPGTPGTGTVVGVLCHE